MHDHKKHGNVDLNMCIATSLKVMSFIASEIFISLSREFFIDVCGISHIISKYLALNMMCVSIEMLCNVFNSKDKNQSFCHLYFFYS